MQRYRSDIPLLRHTGNHARNAAAERRHSSNSRRQLFRGVVVFRAVATHTALEDEVVAESNALVDGEPVADEVHEVVQDLLEVRVAWDSDGDVDAGSDCCPDEARDFGGFAGEDLRSETDGVDVWAVVGDDREGEDDHAELAEGAQVDEDGADEAAGTCGVVACLIAVVAVVDGCGGHDGYSEELGEEERNDESEPGPEEDFTSRLIGGLIDGVISCVRGPACRKAVDNRAIREHRAHFCLTSLPRNINEVSRIRKDAQNNQEDDERRQPSDELVGVHNLVAERADDESAHGDDGDSSAAGNVWVDGFDQLCADNCVHGGPAKARKHVEDGDCGSYVSFILLAEASSANILSFTPYHPYQKRESTI